MLCAGWTTKHKLRSLGQKSFNAKLKIRKVEEETAKWSPVLHDFYNFQLRIRQLLILWCPLHKTNYTKIKNF